MQQTIQGRSRLVLRHPELRRAAVLLPLFWKGGRPHLLFTERSHLVKAHKGQISFPGGAFDASDKTLRQTALRETEEEVGILPSHVKILGELDDMATNSRFLITPYVGVIPHPYDYRPQAREVAQVLEVPLDDLMAANSLTVGTVHGGEHHGAQVYFYQSGWHTIWGVTGHIVKGFLELLAPALAPRAKGDPCEELC